MTSRFENNGSLNPSLHMQVPGEALSDAQRLERIFSVASPVEIAQRLQQFYAGKKDTLNASDREKFVSSVVACLKKMPVDAQPQLRILAELDNMDSDLFGLLLDGRTYYGKAVLGKEVYEPIVKDPSVAIELAGVQPQTLLKLLNQRITGSYSPNFPAIFVDQRDDFVGQPNPLSRTTLFPLFERLAEVDFQAVLKILSAGSRSKRSISCAIEGSKENLFQEFIPMLLKHSQSAHGRTALREFFNALGCNGNAELLEGEITPVKLLAIFFQNSFYYSWHENFIKTNVRFTSKEILQAHKWAAEHLGEKGDLTIDPKEATKMLENSYEVLPFEHPLRRHCLIAITKDYALNHNQVFLKELQSAIASSSYSLDELERILSLIIEQQPRLQSFAFVAEQLEFLRQNRVEDPSKLKAFIKRIAEQIEPKCSPIISKEIIVHETHDKPYATLAKHLPAVAVRIFFTSFEDYSHRGITTLLRWVRNNDLEDRTKKVRKEALFSDLQLAYSTLFSDDDQAYEVDAKTRGLIAKQILEANVITSESPLYEAVLNAVLIQDLPELMKASRPGFAGEQSPSPLKCLVMRSRLLREIASPDNSLEDLGKCLTAYFRMDTSCEHLFPLFISLSQHRSQELASVDELFKTVCSAIYPPRLGSRALVDQMRTFDEKAFFEFANNHPIVTASVLKILNTALRRIKNDQGAELTEEDRSYFTQRAAKLLDIARRSFHEQFAGRHEADKKEALACEALNSALFEGSDPFYADLISLLSLPNFIELLKQEETVNPVITQRLRELIAISGNSIDELSKYLTAYFSLQNSFETIVEVFEALNQRENIRDPDAQKLKEKVFTLICNPERRRAYQPAFPMGSFDRFKADLRALEMLAKDYPYQVIELLMRKFQTPEEHFFPGGSDSSLKPKAMSFLERPETCVFAGAIHEAADAEFIARLKNTTDPDETRKLIELCFQRAIFSHAFIRDIVTNNQEYSFAPQLIKRGTEHRGCHRFFDKETIESLLLSPSGLQIAGVMIKAWDPKTMAARLPSGYIDVKPAFMTDSVELMRLLALELTPEVVRALIGYGCDNKILNSKHITELLLRLQNPASVQFLVTYGLEKKLFEKDDVMSILSHLRDPEIAIRLLDYAGGKDLFDHEEICGLLSSQHDPQVTQKLVQIAATKNLYVADVTRAVLLSKDNSVSAFIFVAHALWGELFEIDEIRDLLSQPLHPDVANVLMTYGLKRRPFDKDVLKEILESSPNSDFKSAVLYLTTFTKTLSKEDIKWLLVSLQNSEAFNDLIAYAIEQPLFTVDDVKELLVSLPNPEAVNLLIAYAIARHLFSADDVKELLLTLQDPEAVNALRAHAIERNLFNAEDVRGLLSNPLDPEVAHKLAAYALNRWLFAEDDEMFDFVVTIGVGNTPDGPYALHKLHLDNRQIPTAVIPPEVEVGGIPISFSLEGMQEAAKAFNVPISQIPKNATVENWRALCKELEFRLNSSSLLQGTYRSFVSLWNTTFSRDYFEQLLDLSSCRTFVPTHKAQFAAILCSLLSHPTTLSAQQDALYWYLHATSSTGGSEKRTTNADYYNGLPPEFKYPVPEKDSDGSEKQEDANAIGVPLSQIPKNATVANWRALCEDLRMNLDNSETFQKAFESFEALWGDRDSVEHLLDFSSYQDVVPADKAQFAAIVSYLLSLPFLSERQEALYWYLDSTSACSSGKRTTNAAYYKGLPPEFKYRAQGLESNESEEVVRAKQEALGVIHDTVEYFLESDTRMYTEFLRLMGRGALSQNVHDIEYVKNSVGYLLGIPDLAFDQYASPLNIKRDQILEICLKYLTPKVLVEMLRKASLKEAKAVSEKDGAVFNPLMTTLIGSSEAFWDISVEDEGKRTELWYQKLNEQGALQILSLLGVINFHAAPVIGNWKKELSFAVEPVGNFEFDMQLTQVEPAGQLGKQMVEFRKRFNAQLKQMPVGERCSYLHTWLVKREESRQKLRDAVSATALSTFDAQWSKNVQEAEKSYETSLQQYLAKALSTFDAQWSMIVQEAEKSYAMSLRQYLTSRLREADALSIITLMELQNTLFHMLFPESTISVAEVSAATEKRRKLQAIWEDGISSARNQRILAEIEGPNLIRALKKTKGIASNLSDEQRATFADILMGEEFLARRWTAFKEELAAYRHLFSSQPKFDIKLFIEFCERAALLLPPEDAERLPKGLVPFDGYADVARDIEELITAVEAKAAVEHILNLNDAKVAYDPLARRFGHDPMQVDMQVNQ